ncbi:MAG: VapC toxin family PIN domain ribonuclease [Cytophagales bacterium CG12_big_fil_rev_8_21_14_0_65_40_12]|nr:MAG: VapC toxin family PIN domain ribonuclease [Cytophagales bacterium CG12_big_fil_rev_8_21_14_0_65_40_12]PIW06057.1 MAG: VapC toxin family PIN domain ribonuclease [Cytophagales bacterium CG17_big_fil_post_rev_8_21_14_2_50_40_13]
MLVDTNVIIYVLNGNRELASLIHSKYAYLSVISELELLSFPKIDKKEEFVIHSFIRDMNLIELNDIIKRETIRLRRAYSLKLPDSIVAATALYLNCPLVTADSGFSRVTELDLRLVNPV